MTADGVSNEINSSVSNSANQIIDDFTQFLSSSPYYLVTFVLAFFSGHVWSYIILSKFTKKEKKILHSYIGRLALGIVWFALIFLFTHLIMYKTLKIDLESFKIVIPTTVLVALALQSIIIVFTIMCRKDKKHMKKVINIISGKGGIGKTLMTAVLADMLGNGVTRYG